MKLLKSLKNRLDGEELIWWLTVAFGAWMCYIIFDKEGASGILNFGGSIAALIFVLLFTAVVFVSTTYAVYSFVDWIIKSKRINSKRSGDYIIHSCVVAAVLSYIFYNYASGLIS